MNILAYIFGAILMVCTLVIIFSLPVLLLWNWLMPVIFGLPEIDIWQSIGLLFLCGFLFKPNSPIKGAK